MNADEVCFLSIAQLAEQIQKREISPVEVSQTYLHRIHTLDPKLNSYLTVTADLALQIIGKPFDEATVLQVGHAYEAHTLWRERRLPLVQTVLCGLDKRFRMG